MTESYIAVRDSGYSTSLSYSKAIEEGQGAMEVKIRDAGGH